MRMLRLVPALLVCFLIGGEITLFTGYASAYCCGCKCMLGCTCPGKFDYGTNRWCYYCRSAEHANLQTSAYVEQLRPASLTIQQKCLRDKVALWLLGMSGERLNVETMSFDERSF